MSLIEPARIAQRSRAWPADQPDAPTRSRAPATTRAVATPASGTTPGSIVRDLGRHTPSRGAAHDGCCRIVVARTTAELQPHIVAWEALAANAIEPNVFLEPWQLLPAIEAFGAGKESLFLLVYRQSTERNTADLLIGLFAFERRNRLNGIPVRTLAAWTHPHLLLSTPLLHADHARPAWTALIEWARAHHGEASILEFPLLLAEGPSHHAAIDVWREQHCTSLVIGHWTRALLRRGRDAESLISSALSSGVRKELRRQRRRLAEKGRLEVARLTVDEVLLPWIDRFLTLEAAGWKGRAGTALDRHANDQRYFQAICAAGHERGQLDMLALTLDGTPIAMKCNFTAGGTAFTLKIAHDEAYKSTSPGVLLELENIAALHRQSALDRMDSCAIPDHPMINRLWPDRREIAHVAICPGGWRGNMALAMFGLLRGVKRSVRRQAVPAKSKGEVK